MNQELKQRLIGAVVVTALAAIFIPMLFDDPVDNSGQSVSELVIPATPLNTGEESANKLPTSANQVLNMPDADSETVVNTEEEAELSLNRQPPSEEPIDAEPEVNDEGMDQPIDDSQKNRSSAALDAGVDGDSNKPVKSKKAIPETVETSKQKSAMKQASEANNTVTTPKKPAKKTEKSAAKPAKSDSAPSRWTIQAGTFSKKENAMSLMETLRKQGLPVTMETTKNSSSTPLYRLKVGSALDKKRAAEMKAKLDKQNIQAFIIAE